MAADELVDRYQSPVSLDLGRNEKPPDLRWKDSETVPSKSDVLTVELATVPIAVTAPQPIAGWIFERLRLFTTTAEPVWRIEVSVTGPTPSFLRSPRQVFPAPVTVVEDKDGFHLDSPTFSAHVDLVRKVVNIQGPLASYPLDVSLRQVLPLLVEDSLVLHSCLIVRDGRAFVCAGDSGRGKSTLAALAGESALCDELTLLTLEDQGFRATALPYWVSRPGSAPLSAILLLRHGKENRILSVPASQIMRELSRQILWPVGGEEGVAPSLETLGRLVDEVPVRILQFVPDERVLQTIDQEAW